MKYIVVAVEDQGADHLMYQLENNFPAVVAAKQYHPSDLEYLPEEE